MPGRLAATGQLLLSVGLCLLAGAIGSLATIRSVGSWYQTLAKPAFTPPNALFGPVWTGLYILMGIAAWLVWRQSRHTQIGRLGLELFAAQLILNLLWSLVFFGLHSILGGLAIIAALWVLILGTTLTFGRARPAAGIIMLPYLLWVTFACLLNWAIYRLNL